MAGVATVVSLASISTQSALIGASFNICAGLAITVVAVMTWQAAEQCTKTMIEFNDFLQSYR